MALKKLYIHLISDSTCEVLCSVKRGVLQHFPGIEEEEYIWTFVHNASQINNILTTVKKNPGIILYNLHSKELIKMIQDHCAKNPSESISALAHLIDCFANYSGIEAQNHNRQKVLDQDYFNRMQAINFTIAHDDGQLAHELNEADIILIGPSRTSKSPLCVYLAYRGFKAANIPFVPQCPMPDFGIYNKPLMIGLTINPETLLHIRNVRIMNMSDDVYDNYNNIDAIKEELLAAKKLYRAHNWSVIDITKKSVEETAGKIVRLHLDRKRNKPQS